MSAPRITVVGSINLDLVVTCDALPVAGQTVLGRNFQPHPGGKGANQALAAQRLGAEVTLVGRVGTDAQAETALALLRAGGVRLALGAADSDSVTGIALIAVSQAGENQIIVAPGANELLTPADLPGDLGPALIGQLEIPVATLVAAADRCTGFVCLNLAPAIEVPVALLQRADLLIVNEGEAEFYGRERLFSAGGLTAITLGAAGACLYRDGVEIARAGSPKIEVVDTTGAGDTFVAALCLALLEQQGPDAALNFACAAAALSTTRPGAQPALPLRSAVEHALTRGLT